MRYRSTRGGAPPVDFFGALFHGLAPDGGLYLPESIPIIRRPPRSSDGVTSLADTAFAVLRPFVDDLPDDELRRLGADALDFPIPLVEEESGVFVLELFHGPTLAFKDVGARFQARLMSAGRRREPRDLTILVATSGDTGSAVAQAFHGMEGFDVVVLYPEGGVSALQEKQFTTLGGNVVALAVRGVFDDCQRLVKEAFRDPELRERRGLTSANSINLGRLLPQAIYYFHAADQLPPGSPPPLFVTPSGNFGNLCAGLIASRMGLPTAGFVAATNVNDVVPEYLRTGELRPRPSIRTISNAMDVGDPSNFERIRELYGGDVAAIRRDITGSAHDDAATREAIRDVHVLTGRVLDPHTAVGWLGMQEARAERRHRPGASGSEPPAVLLATAHPAKFREDVEAALGRPVELPARLAACLDRESRSVPIEPRLSALRDVLLG